MITAATDKRDKAKKIGDLLAQSKTDDEIRALLCIGSTEELDQVLELHYADLIDKLKRKSPERQFADYMTKQGQGIRTLDQLIRDLRGPKNTFTAAVASSVVSAVKARAAIIDQIEERGKQLGLMQKEIQRRMIAGIQVDKLSTDQLRAAVVAQVKELTVLERYESVSLLELDTGDIYREDLPKPTGKRRTKIRRGRHVSKAMVLGQA